MAKKAVAIKEEAGLPADLIAEMEADAGAGQADITASDVSIPFLRILQQMSPQCVRSKGEYIEGAQAGQIFNTVTGELWDQNNGPIIVPCSYNFKYIVWADRQSKTHDGIQSTYTRMDEQAGRLPSTTRDNRNREITEDGHILTPTSEFYILIVNEETGTFEQAVVSCSSTQLTPAKKWNAIIKQQIQHTAKGPKPAAIFSRSYKTRTIDRSNDDGDWAVWEFSLNGPLQNLGIYRAAKGFATAIESGKVEAKYNQSDETHDDVM
jgi:hypothetical protein